MSPREGERGKKKLPRRNAIITFIFSPSAVLEEKTSCACGRRDLCLSLPLSLQTCRLWQSQAAAAEEEAEFPAGGDESMQRERGGGREHINVISPQSSFEKMEIGNKIK